MDLTESLRHTENSLRDFIAQAMREIHSEGWEKKAGIDPKTIKNWEDTKKKEDKKQKNGVVEPRLIYYAEFSHLKPLLKDNWESMFQAVFDVEWAIMDVWLESLYLVRNQEAHGREILEHHKHSAMGAAGEIRTRLIRYRSKMETAEDYFPRIERVSDGIETVWVLGSEQPLKAQTVLHPDDIVTFTIIASDPQGSEPEYCVTSLWQPYLTWQKSNVVHIKLTQEDIRKVSPLIAYIRGTSGNYHANGHWDDKVEFHYTVLPKK